MIKLKNGTEVAYDKDFDLFFLDLMGTIIRESMKSAARATAQAGEDHQSVLLREIMDNCILVSHQIFELSREHENLSKFMVSGCLFNCILLMLQKEDKADPGSGGEGADTVH